MTTLQVDLLIGTLLVIALYRRPQGLVLVLAASFGAAIFAREGFSGDHLKPVLMALDALTVISAWALWWRHVSTRASLVAWVGLCKIMLAFASTLSMPYLAWAVANNALFVVMILVAGGLTDGIIAWLGRWLAGVGARRDSVRGHLVRFP